MNSPLGPAKLLEILTIGGNTLKKQLSDEQLIHCKEMTLEVNEKITSLTTNPLERLMILFAITEATLQVLMGEVALVNMLKEVKSKSVN